MFQPGDTITYTTPDGGRITASIVRVFMELSPRRGELAYLTAADDLVSAAAAIDPRARFDAVDAALAAMPHEGTHNSDDAALMRLKEREATK